MQSGGRHFFEVGVQIERARRVPDKCPFCLVHDSSRFVYGRSEMWAKPALARAIRIANTRFGQTVRALRLSQGVTQEQVAEHTGLHPKYVSRVEGGAANPSLAVVVAIAHALDVVPAALLAGYVSKRR